MSDYRDVVKKSIEEGWYLDSCGSDERHYTWGSWIDLCGMSVEDAKKAPDSGGGQGGGGGEESGKTKNTVTFLMQKGSDNEYSLYLSASQAPTSDVLAYFSFNGTMQMATLPAGVTSFNTGLKGEDATKPYAEVTGISLSSEDEKYTYTSKNTVKTGIFTLTINNDGETTVEQVKYGEQVVLDTPEPREGYDFVWKDSDGNVVDPNNFIMPEKNITVTGTYVIKKYTLTYNIYKEVCEGDEIDTVLESGKTATVEYGKNIYSVVGKDAAERQGYTFSGWTDGVNVITSASTMPASDLEISGTFRLNKYTLKYMADNAVYDEYELYYTQNTKAPAEMPSKTGYNTIGWDKQVPATMPANNFTVNAVFEAIIYRITYFVDGVEKYSEEHIYEDPISIRADEVKEGYTFSGWDATLPATMPAEDIVVNGTFTINQYTLTFISDGATYTSITADYGTQVPAIVDPSKVGYTFEGWTPEVPTAIPATDMTFNAQFQINQYNVNYVLDGEPYKTDTYDYDAEITPAEEPAEREGYTFSGWSEIPERMPDHDVEVNGQFNINSYVLSYFVDDELYLSAMTEYNAEITPTEEPAEREGYTFSGWDNVPERMPAADVNVHGTFDINYHTLAYFVDDVMVSSGSVAYGTEIIPQDYPEQIGYTFSGWTSIPATMPDNDVRVDGWFIINQYTLTFIVDGESGTPYTSITEDYGTPVPEIANPSKAGYTFSGWDKEIPATIPAEDMIFNGTLDINHWTAEYLIDGEHYSSVTLEYGATIEYPDVPKEGYDLIWNEEYETMPDHDITINGEYVEHPVPKTVYYGAVLDDDKTTWTDVSGMSSYEYVDNEEMTNWFAFSGIPEYAEIEEKYNDGEITDEEFDEWCNAHNRVSLFSMPTTAQLISVKNGTNVDVTNAVKPGQITMVGTDEYQCYYIDTNPVPPVADDGGFNYKITIQTK